MDNSVMWNRKFLGDWAIFWGGGNFSEADQYILMLQSFLVSELHRKHTNRAKLFPTRWSSCAHTSRTLMEVLRKIFPGCLISICRVSCDIGEEAIHPIFGYIIFHPMELPEIHSLYGQAMLITEKHVPVWNEKFHRPSSVVCSWKQMTFT